MLVRTIVPLIALSVLSLSTAGCSEREIFLGPRPTLFKSALFPVEVVAGAGGMPAGAAFGENGDLLVAGFDTDSVFAIAKADGSLRTVATGVTGGGANVLSVAWVGGTLYAGASNGVIYTIDAMGVSTPWLTLAPVQAVNGLALAPPGFPTYGGQLVAVTSQSATGPGNVIAIDLATPTNNTVVFTDANAAFVDLAFSRTGTLYVVDYTGTRIITASAAGSTVVAGGFTEPVGVALDERGGLLFVADAGDDTVKTVTLAGGAVAPLGAFDIRPGALPSGIVYDEVGNLILMTQGSSVARAAIVPGLNPGFFPISVPAARSGFGGVTFDGGGAIFGTSNGLINAVIRIDRETGEGIYFRSGIGSSGEELLSITYQPAPTALFIGSSRERILLIDRVGALYQLTDFSAQGYGRVTGLAIAPANYGTRGGRLIAVTDLGNVLDVDPSTGATVLVGANAGAALAGLAFAADGTLYAANHTAGSVVTIDPATGAITDFATGLGQPDGVVIDQLGTTLYVADSQGNTLWGVSVPGAVATNLGTYDFDDGPEPSPLAFDGLGQLLLGTGETGLTLETRTVFP